MTIKFSLQVNITIAKAFLAHFWYKIWLVFYFLSSVSFVVNLHAKFEVSSLHRSLDMEGVPKFEK